MFGVKQKSQYGTYYSSPSGGGASGKSKFLMIGLIAAVLVAVGLFAASLFSNNDKDDLALLAARESSLLTVATAAKDKISSSPLSVANSNAIILLTSDTAGLINVTGIKKIPDNLKKQEADTNTETLSQAELLGTFDETYAKIVLQKVNIMISEAEALENNVSSKTYRDAISASLENLKSIQKQFKAATGR